jgi:hypothetical protein
MSSEEVVYEATPSSPESFIYQVEAAEGVGDEELAETFLQRRNDLLGRINEEDKMHNAMIIYQQECSEKTRDLVRQRRRVREGEEKRRAGFEKSLESRSKTKALDASQQYQKELEAKYDEPKSKLRKPKAQTPKVPTGFIAVPTDGPTEAQIDGRTKADEA